MTTGNLKCKVCIIYLFFCINYFLTFSFANEKRIYKQDYLRNLTNYNDHINELQWNDLAISVILGSILIRLKRISVNDLCPLSREFRRFFLNYS